MFAWASNSSSLSQNNTAIFKNGNTGSTYPTSPCGSGVPPRASQAFLNASVFPEKVSCNLEIMVLLYAASKG